MSDNLFMLPSWKLNATAEDRFLELAVMARQHPERFNRLLVVWDYDAPENKTVTRYVSAGCQTIELLGLLRVAEKRILDFAEGEP